MDDELDGAKKANTEKKRKADKQMNAVLQSAMSTVQKRAENRDPEATFDEGEDTQDYNSPSPKPKGSSRAGSAGATPSTKQKGAPSTNTG
eukprot:3283595-Rhodomonas_salina.1